MPTKFSTGQRIVHATLGLGTVIETEGDSCRVELDRDDGQRVRTFMISLGTIAPADEIPTDHPPTDQVHAQPKALEPKPEPQQPETPMPKDTLLEAMNAALADRGKGAIAGLTATLGISKNTPNNWRHLGRIPDHQRDAVQAWIDKPQVVAVRVEKAKPAPKAKTRAAKPAIKFPAATPMPPIRSAIDHSTVLQALGLTITTAWLPDGETMRQVRVAVLP